MAYDAAARGCDAAEGRTEVTERERWQRMVDEAQTSYGWVQPVLDALTAAEARIAELTAERDELREALKSLRETFDANADQYERSGNEYNKAVARGYRCASTYVISSLALVGTALATAAEQQNTTGNSSAASSLAAASLRETLANGGEINVPSLGLVIGHGGVRSVPAAEQQEGGEGE